MTADEPVSWRAEIRGIHDEAFARDWSTAAEAISQRFGLLGPAALRPSVAGLPPIWFQGDIDRVEPGNWMLVMSLNHQLPNQTEYADVSRDTSWDTWCSHHVQHWNEGFFGPLTRLAASAMGAQTDDTGLAGYAVEHLIFTELCPYASDSFPHEPDKIRALMRSDPASQTVTRIRTILLDRGAPALVLVNGWPAMEAFAEAHRDHFEWRPWEVYDSDDTPREGRARKRLWHGEGIYQGPATKIPVVGFPFLRKPNTHNSYVEIAQLAERIRAFMAATASPR